RRGPASEGSPPRADGHPVRAEDRDRLGGLAARRLRLLVQDVSAEDRGVVATGPVATHPRAVPVTPAWRRRARLVACADRYELCQGSAGWIKTGPNPTDRGRSASKHCVLTDATGVPLVVQFTAANEHDLTTALPLVLNIPAVGGKRGAPKRKPGSLV